jgi:hypothetical protein
MTTLRKEEPVYSFESKIMKLNVSFSIREKIYHTRRIVHAKLCNYGKM